jgi:hypothetical protein
LLPSIKDKSVKFGIIYEFFEPLFLSVV